MPIYTNHHDMNYESGEDDTEKLIINLVKDCMSLWWPHSF